VIVLVVEIATDLVNGTQRARNLLTANVNTHWSENRYRRTEEGGHQGRGGANKDRRGPARGTPDVETPYPDV